jgi:hypothetical protein
LGPFTASPRRRYQHTPGVDAFKSRTALTIHYGSATRARERIEVCERGLWAHRRIISDRVFPKPGSTSNRSPRSKQQRKIPISPSSRFSNASNGPGWRAGEKGEQQIRIIFDQPISVRRIHLLIAAQHNAGARSDCLRRLRTSRQHGQFLLLLSGHMERFGRASDGHTQVCTGSAIYSTKF